MIHVGLGVVLTVTDIVLGAVALLPLASFATWALAQLRILGGAAPAWAWRASLAEVGIVCGTLPWVWLTMLPGSGAGVVPGRVSLVPLRDLETMSDVQIYGNLLILAAVGLLVPVRFAALATWPRIVVFAAACSAAIETAQYALQLDRVSSVDDVLLNTAGAGMAAVLSWPWWARVARAAPTTVNPPLRGTAGATASGPRRSS